MVPARRKKAAYSKRTRDRMKIQRDALNLEYLRTVRDLSKAEIAERGGTHKPLSVYSVEPFPLRYQFRETKLSSGKVKYEYMNLKMPQWKDLTLLMKVELFQLLCEEVDKCLYTFNPKIHPELEEQLSFKPMVTLLGKRVKRRLDAIGDMPQHHFFVVEGHNKRGEPVKPHLHGMAMVEDTEQAKAVKIATGKAAGQDILGRGKMPSGNRGRFCYYVEGKSWASYITKNLSRDAKVFGRRSFVFSRKANGLAREFYELITGQGK